MSLARAREKRDEARTLLADGIEPSEARKHRKLADMAASANSFEAIAREWRAGKSKAWAKVTADKAMTHLQAYVFHEVGHIPVASVKAAHLLATLSPRASPTPPPACGKCAGRYSAIPWLPAGPVRS